MSVTRDPGPAYNVVGGITSAVFDNLMMKVGYSTMSVGGETGSKIEMTNWATVFLPETAMPGGSVDIDAILGGGGIFKPLLDMDAFLDSFSIYASDIVANQKSRWSKYLEWAAAAASIWGDDEYDSPYPPTKFHFHDPIFDRLQASYEDVNFEINHMRNSNYHKYSDAIQLGGDGLSYIRMLQRISQDPRKYLETKPIVIPRMGENPHGLFHIMHGDWRIWSPLLMRFAEIVDNKQVKADPTVADFNTCQHFLRIVIQACAEFVAEISQSGTDYHIVQAFTRRDAEKNLSFAYIVFFLYCFGFKFLEYRHAVRHNESHSLDRLWRENLVSARTATANKVNYRQMSVCLVYWGLALVEPLQTFYHNTRTIRWIHSHVVWDMPIEKLNMWLKESVVSNISRWQICQFISRLNFMQHVMRSLLSLVRRGRKRDKATPKNVRVDVDKIKAFLHAKIGSTYTAATAASDDNLLGVDMARWGGNRGPAARRACAPFQQLRQQAGYREYVQEQVTKLCRWQKWN